MMKLCECQCLSECYGGIVDEVMCERHLLTPRAAEQDREQVAMAREVGEMHNKLPLPPNPKQIFGDAKVPVHLVPPASVIHEAMAFKEGARKYGPYNWRENAVENMTYIGAALRHIYSYLDGAEYDHEVASRVHHLGEAKACLGVILDALETGNLVDTRPKAGASVQLLTALKAEDPARLSPAPADH